MESSGLIAIEALVDLEFRAHNMRLWQLAHSQTAMTLEENNRRILELQVHDGRGGCSVGLLCSHVRDVTPWVKASKSGVIHVLDSTSFCLTRGSAFGVGSA